uniref:Phage protein n=1 Tax=viral metagenome TaxID=1070528 RepID=A0A6M3L0F0_9ZZZZ
MTLPKRVKIGGLTYEVRSTTKLKGDQNEKLYGNISYVDLIINVDNRAYPARAGESLLHEIIHGIADERNTAISEKMVHVLTAGFYQFMVDNPKVVKFIMGRE